MKNIHEIWDKHKITNNTSEATCPDFFMTEEEFMNGILDAVTISLEKFEQNCENKIISKLKMFDIYEDDLTEIKIRTYEELIK